MPPEITAADFYGKTLTNVFFMTLLSVANVRAVRVRNVLFRWTERNVTRIHIFKRTCERERERERKRERGGFHYFYSRERAITSLLFIFSRH